MGRTSLVGMWILGWGVLFGLGPWSQTLFPFLSWVFHLCWASSLYLSQLLGLAQFGLRGVGTYGCPVALLI